MTQPGTNSIVDEMAEAMHMATAESTISQRSVIPRAGYSGEYNRYLIKQAEAALQVVKRHYKLMEKSDD